jgi:hypothetical protein
MCRYRRRTILKGIPMVERHFGGKVVMDSWDSCVGHYGTSLKGEQST